ncbi:hypothetical protein CTAYLR_006746 [Chrysophaeum taylorii]|uniref:Cytochrome P450 n=1 Tax=Chrysophaeum taylorii TaxID=2483200 RepID=A0AAD7UBD3_9STRA|nr:hypothetical protein CTAYLR_006746 [Chrysophaeum taylorii]
MLMKIVVFALVVVVASGFKAMVVPPRASQRLKTVRRRVVDDKVTGKRLEFEEKTINGWEDSWDNATRSGFDWEMEKLRRRLEELVPSTMFGPRYWRFLMEENPESEYRQYAGSTYPGSKPGQLDAFRILFNNLLQFVLGNESEDGAVVAAWDWRSALDEHGLGKFAYSILTGDLQTIVGGPLFLLLTKYHRELGPVFKLAFGPRSFIVVADPAVAKHLLRDGSKNYDKGILSEILQPILGNGLIPADPDVWKRRRRVIAPGFHRAWLDQTLSLFDDCAADLIGDLAGRASLDPGDLLPKTPAAWKAWKHQNPPPGVVDMEERFCSVSLDIIGKAVFDYDFGSSNSESPLVRAVYRCLYEAERRTTAFVPFWLLPGAQFLIPSQRDFNRDLRLLNAKLDELVRRALEADDDDDDDDERISLLDFLVTMRGEDVSTTQLRDDLMTMLVAGHETTAALLTWVLYELFHPSGRSSHHLKRLREELDAVVGARAMTYADILDCKFARLCLAEGLRLYPQPPLLIRRALDDDQLPTTTDRPVRLARGADVFLSTWSLHKSPDLWDNPETFDPSRFEKKKQGRDGWAGYDPDSIPATSLYPNEQTADFAFLPFGAGSRRCLGDQFAILESTVMLARLITTFDFEFAVDPKATLEPKTGLGGLPVADVGMRTGATIHTENGLWMTVHHRTPPLPLP